MLKAAIDPRGMGPLLVVLFAAANLACLQLDTGTDAGTDAGGGTVSTSAGSPTGTPQGAGCSPVLQTQASLCEQISTCPGVDVDPGVFPDCGFRIQSGSTLDLECLCNTALCPVGVATSCAEAAQLLAAQNEFSVCEQEAEGRCVEQGTPTTTSSSCDKTCESECAGDPSCIQLCGC